MYYCYSKPSPVRIDLTQRLVEAGADFLYLLERGYGREVALNLVTARWRLSRLERLALYRSVFDRTTSRARVSKIVYSCTRLAIDGFNVLSTIQSALLGDSLIQATDGVIRDLSASVRKVRVGPLLASALSLMLEYVERMGVSEVLVVFDAQVSRSGEFSKIAQEMLHNFSIEGSAVTNSKADSFLISCSDEYPVATSDSLLLDRVHRVVDLGGRVGRFVAEENIINLKALIEARVREIAEDLAAGARANDEEDGDESQPAPLREGHPGAAR